MAYFGKEFKFEKEENYDAFIAALASKNEKANTFLIYKPNQTLLKNGDDYTLAIELKENNFRKEIPFKSGVAFDETLAAGITAKTVFTVDGDTFTQVQDYGNGTTVTLKREFSANGLKVTATSSLWDGVAYRYYVPA